MGGASMSSAIRKGIDMAQRKISSVMGLALRVRPLTAAEIESGGAALFNHVALVRKDSGVIVATVARDDLFDRDGNRFYWDC